MTREQLENAVRAWVRPASGLTEDQVYFGRQNVRRGETAARIIILFGDFVPRGVARLDHEYDAGQPNGQEIEYSATETGELTVTLQAFAPDTVGNATPAELLKKCAGKLRLPSYRDALNAAGLGVLEVLPVQELPQVVSGEWEGGAFLEVRLALVQVETERTGYIETVLYDIDVTHEGDT